MTNIQMQTQDIIETKAYYDLCEKLVKEKKARDNDLPEIIIQVVSPRGVGSTTIAHLIYHKLNEISTIDVEYQGDCKPMKNYPSENCFNAERKILIRDEC